MFETIIPIGGIVVAILTASLSYFLTKRSQAKDTEARLKEKYYLHYIKSLSEFYTVSQDPEYLGKLMDAHNHLLLIGSVAVVKNLMNFTKHITEETITTNSHEVFLTELIKAMREDIHQNILINEGYPQVDFYGIELKTKKSGTRRYRLKDMG